MEPLYHSLSNLLSWNHLFSAATGVFPCLDTHRTHSFDAYYRCNCTGGYQGMYCEDDINECLSDPCMFPYVCYNKLNHYVCACPEDNPNCEILPWMIAIILLIVILIIVLVIVGIYRFRNRKKDYLLKDQFGSQSSLGSEFNMDDDDDLFEDEKGFSETTSEGFENPALSIEPHYDPEEERDYFNRHTKSSFAPLLHSADSPPPSYDQPGDHPHPDTFHGGLISKGPDSRMYLAPGTLHGHGSNDSGTCSPALKRNRKIQPVEDDEVSIHSQVRGTEPTTTETKPRSNTPDIFRANNTPNGRNTPVKSFLELQSQSSTPGLSGPVSGRSTPVTSLLNGESRSRCSTPTIGMHNKVSPANSHQSPSGSRHSGSQPTSSNDSSSQRETPHSLEMTKLTISDMENTETSM